MLDARELTPSDHISGEELRARGPQAVTIASVTKVEMSSLDPNKKIKKPRGVISFREEGARPWVINKTNRIILQNVFGGGRCGKQPGGPDEHADGLCNNTAHWVGQRIGLGATTQQLGQETTDGIIVVGADCLDAPLVVEVKLPNKKPRKYTVSPPNGRQSRAQSQVQQRRADVDPNTGERVPGVEA